MEYSGCIFENRNFGNFYEMVETLLNEASKQVVRIELGEIQNTHKERIYIKWRLVHLQACFQCSIPGRYRPLYNSLWSQLYRLEHASNYRHPYTIYLLEQVFAKAERHT